MISVAQLTALPPCPCASVPLSHAQALWRAYALLRVDRERVSTNYTSFKERQVFHALVALYALLETAAAASEREAHRMYTKAGYGMHLVALCVQVSAVSVVVRTYRASTQQQGMDGQGAGQATASVRKGNPAAGRSQCLKLLRITSS